MGPKASAWMQKVQCGRQSENRTASESEKEAGFWGRSNLIEVSFLYDRRTLFIMPAEWRGFEKVDEAVAARTG
ncbi:hypothetical protein QFZ77_006509 [Paenibacillus sp. V4I3]|uniref:hypothetical protein n=1 Tax=Paenibacillus sp. V4I3 TaxID=3042305 RepID=UPI0027877F3A|nr:hypothetical protein [Paenibacillus sp. V4I3]MDQ0877850.1 hypothetical protein [Paenibacillus sp. V4I3]